MATIKVNGRPDPAKTPRLRAVYTGGTSAPISPGSGDNNTLETLGVGAAQAGAFYSLRIPKNIPDSNKSQFQALKSDSYQPDSPDGYSKLGTPIYGKVILGNDNGQNRYTVNTGSAEVEVTFETVELDCALVEIGLNKQIVKTDIQGLDYSIKEFMSGTDDDVTITGRFDSTPDVAPMDFIINLNKILKAPIPIPVANYYLNSNNIYYLCIKPGSRVWQTEGGYACQEFVIEAWSDVPLEQMLP